MQWDFAGDQILVSSFPVDPIRQNYVREVRNALFSAVSPIPLKESPLLAAVSEDVLMYIMDLDPFHINNTKFVNFASGIIILPGTEPLSHRYGGHQFGYWADQLGDGRAVMLGEYVNRKGERWELQLKGSGLTPYSRRGDGRAVIRSSLREFLCSEAMHALGIPTSRAASLVVSYDQVIRDQFYNGNFKKERAAVVLRLAQSWFRFGSLEILAEKQEISLLRNLTDFIIVHYFPNINSTDPDRHLSLLQEIVLQTADMIALWQSVGFTHGVCNTDNFSILSITIDYGPFGFMEEYNPKFVPNTSDDEGRYSYEKQPDVGIFNLEKLKVALHPLSNKDQIKQMDLILKGYVGRYKSKFMELFCKKLGIVKCGSDEEQLVAILLKTMEDSHADFTMTFRELSEIDIDTLVQSANTGKFSDQFWTLNKLAQHEWFKDWCKVYAKHFTDKIGRAHV